MHQCLLLPELARRIVKECILVHDVEALADKEGLRTLNNLSRTCYALSEPALDMMWYRLDELQHAIKCLPSDL